MLVFKFEWRLDSKNFEDEMGDEDEIDVDELLQEAKVVEKHDPESKDEEENMILEGEEVGEVSNEIHVPVENVEDDERETEEVIIKRETVGNEPDENEDIIANKDDDEIPDMMAKRSTISDLRTNMRPINSHKTLLQ